MTTKLQSIIATVIHADRPTLDGFTHPLPESAQYRIRVLADRGELDRYISHEDLIALRVNVEKPNPQHTFGNDHPECAYLVFADGSLYWQTNADSEVWADARDFVVERVFDHGNKDASDFAPDSDEGLLIRAVAPSLVSGLPGFLCGFGDASGQSDADAHWAAYSRQLSDAERERVERGGYEAGLREGAAYRSLVS